MSEHLASSEQQRHEIVYLPWRLTWPRPRLRTYVLRAPWWLVWGR